MSANSRTLHSLFRITATQKHTDPPRVEIFEVVTTTGAKAKRQAVAQNAARLGWPYVRRGRGYFNTEGWAFKIERVRSVRAHADCTETASGKHEPTDVVEARQGDPSVICNACGEVIE